ncbi:hypothetical protein HPB50_019466 [Hyalomma asiaticum]|uniref:Uncharacterized protein n=1 Tax=Hyalomma asiaticum TaxID=266040 RepID=A0ACB7S3X1_HYAAI|nr:hypothetical protein HPB50_019466 [Hyalomma asiaticum]
MSVRSLPAHAVDVSHDHVVREEPLLCLTESCIDTAVELQGCKCVSLAKRQNHRAAGVAVYDTSTRPHFYRAAFYTNSSRCPR